MNHLGRIIAFGIGATAFLLLPALGRAEGTATVVISEVAWAGSSASASDEWIELANPGDAAADLTGWRIDGAATGGKDFFLPDGLSIAPHSVVLIANYAETHDNSALARTPDHASASLALSNRGLGLVLRDADGIAVDRAGDGGRPFAGRTLGEGDAQGPVSMVRSDARLSGDSPDAWVDASTADGFKDGMPDLGTPGTHKIANETDDPEEPAGDEGTEQEEDGASDPSPAEPAQDDAEQTEEIEESSDPSSSETAQDEKEETETSQDTESEVPVETVYPPGTLVINELVADPLPDRSEFVEILNPYNNVIDLGGWSVRDASGKATALPDQLLGFGQAVVVNDPRGNLNNGSETVELVDPRGAVIDSVAYGKDALPSPKKGEALARTEDGFMITETPTPGLANLISRTQEPEPAAPPEPKPQEMPEKETKPVAVEEPPEDIAPEVPPVPITLKLWEIYANTDGRDAEDEFVELKNVGTETIDPNGAVLEDLSGTRHTVEGAGAVPPGGLLLLRRTETGMTLNNDKETVRLYRPDGKLLDLKSYERHERGHSLSREGNDWRYTQRVTPSEPNRFPPPAPAAVQTDGPKPAPRRTRTVSAAKRGGGSVRGGLTVLDAKALADDTRVRVEGSVTALPDTAAGRAFYLADATGGLQIYKHDNDFPELTLGDRVSVTGELSTAYGARRLKITKEGILSVLGSGATLPPAQADADAIGPDRRGTLVRLSGTVVSRSGSKVALEDDGGGFLVRIRDGAGIDASVFAPGANASVAGILTETDPPTVTPRSMQDIGVRAREEPPVLAGTGKSEKREDDRAAGTLLLAAIGLALAALAAHTYLIKPYYARHHALRVPAPKTG